MDISANPWPALERTLSSVSSGVGVGVGAAVGAEVGATVGAGSDPHAAASNIKPITNTVIDNLRRNIFVSFIWLFP